jgi:large subunit ribosomal protein L17
MKKRKLERKASHREALLRNLTVALIKHKRITTTEAKAKELKRTIEKVINLGKTGDFNAYRRVAPYLNSDRAAMKEFFKKIIPNSTSRQSGYTRVIKMPPRKGDNSKMALIELLLTKT